MSRLSGDNFEYNCIKHIKDIYQLKYYDDYSKDKFEKWQNEKSVKTYKFPNIDFVRQYKYLKLIKDGEGILGNTNDLELYDDDDNMIGFSFKHNNLSLKHPRANAISKCFTEKNKETYDIKYAELNKKWFDATCHHGVFNKIDESQKMQMYKEFINILFHALKSPKSLAQTLSFCLSSKGDQYVCHTNNKSDNIVIYKKINFSKKGKCKISRKKSNTLEVVFSDLVISFRIHTASSKITKTLSLKYDVKCSDIEKLCTRI